MQAEAYVRCAHQMSQKIVPMKSPMTKTTSKTANYQGARDYDVSHSNCNRSTTVNNNNNCQQLQQHIYVVLCRKNKTNFTYLVQLL